jgi:tetratricopeptide (TPR) repeat protein
MSTGGPQNGREPGRNDPCPCGSGRKYKQCCQEAAAAGAAQARQVDEQYRRGMAFERAGRVKDAVAAYRSAIAIGEAPLACSRLGHIFQGLRRFEDAAKAFRAAAASDPDSPERRMDLVRSLLAEKREAEAQVEVRRVVAMDPRNADAHWMLGRMLSDSGRFAEADDALERSATLNPDQGVVYYDLTRARTITEADRPLIRRMQAAARALERPGQSVEQAAMLQLALAKAFDDLRDFESAMRHIAAANRLKKAMGVLDRAALASRTDRLIDRFTPSFIASMLPSGDPSARPILIVGLPRSGTTLVEQILSSHPEVAAGGEMQFWPTQGPLLERARSPQDILGVRQRMAAGYLDALNAVSPTAARVTDKNPFNFLWAGWIHVVFPHATVIHCRRHPIDTCLSISSTYFPQSAEFSTDPEDLVAYYAQYSRLTAHWRDVLPSDRFIEVDYEALTGDPEPITRSLVAACGLAWDPACLHPERNERIVRTASRWQVRQPVYRTSTERWRRYEPWLGGLADLAGERQGGASGGPEDLSDRPS